MFFYCMCQSKGKYCGMWSMGSPAFLLSSAAANKAAAIHWGSTAAICGQEKKNCSSAQSLCCAWGAVSCALLDMITWIDIISYFVKPAEWSGEMKLPLRGKRLWKKNGLGLGFSFVGGVSWEGSVGEWLDRDEEQGGVQVGQSWVPWLLQSILLACLSSAGA